MSDVPTSGPKVATIQVSTDNEQDLETFAEEVKKVINEAGVAKRATYLTGYYLVDGQPVRANGKNAITGEDATKKDERPKKKAAKKAASRKTEPEPEPKNEAPEDDDEKADAVRATAKKVAKSTRRVSMRKGGDEVATETESTT